MALGRKRKSESVSVADEASTPSKRAATDMTATPATPATGEKKGRGRPRKYPEGSIPVRPEGPKRGRGRPRKDPSATGTPKATPKSKTPGSTSRGRGRPRKYPVTSDSTPKSKPSAIEADENTDNDSGRSYWLMKAEPESRIEKGKDIKFSIDDLRAAKEPEAWDGVRNPVARKHMQLMKKGDLAFFYHSNCKVPGIAGVMEVVQEHSTDETAFDPSHPYYDEKSNRESPKWVVVHVEFRRKFDDLITLDELKSHGNAKAPLENLQMLKQTRLSVSAVSPKEWDFIMSLVKESENTESADDSSKENVGTEKKEGEPSE